MLGKLSSDSDVTFGNKAAVGEMEIVGKLTYSKTGEDPLEISTAQEIKTGKFSLSKGVTLKFSAPISIGWTIPNLTHVCNVTFGF